MGRSTVGRVMLRLLDQIWPGHPDTWKGVRERLTPVIGNLLRLTVGGVLGYLVTLLVTDGRVDLTGALTALLVIQASAAGSARMGLVRVGAVVIGIGVALLVSLWVGLSWWSLGLVIFGSLILAKVFRLGDQLLETPISAMVILAASGQQILAENRVLTTLVGVSVGVALPILWPPPIPVPSAAAAVRRVAQSLAQTFREAAEHFDENPVTGEAVEQRLRSARTATTAIGRASEQIDAVHDIWQWNPRALGRADVVPLLRSGLESLQTCASACRALFMAMLQQAPDALDPQDAFDDELRSVFAVVLRDTGECIDSFGRLVEAETRGAEAELEELLRDNMELLMETRAVLTELMLVTTHEPRQWVLHGSILRVLDEILASLDADHRARARAEWRSRQASRPLPSRATSSELPVMYDRTWLRAIRSAGHRGD